MRMASGRRPEMSVQALRGHRRVWNQGADRCGSLRKACAMKPMTTSGADSYAAGRRIWRRNGPQAQGYRVVLFIREGDAILRRWRGPRWGEPRSGDRVMLVVVSFFISTVQNKWSNIKIRKSNDIPCPADSFGRSCFGELEKPLSPTFLSTLGKIWISKIQRFLPSLPAWKEKSSAADLPPLMASPLRKQSGALLPSADPSRRITPQAALITMKAMGAITTSCRHFFLSCVPLC